MRISRKNNSKKRIAIIVSVVFVTGVAAFFAYLYFKPSSQETNKEQASDSRQTTDSTSGTDDLENGTNTSTEDLSPTNKSTMEPENTETEKNGSIAKPTILSAKQTDSEHIRVSASFTETANGTCQLTLTKTGEAPITKSADIIVVPSGYACNGFTVVVPSEGGWTAEVTHIYNNKSASSSIKVE